MHKKIRSLVLASLITISSTGQIIAIPQNYDNKETKQIVNEDISNQSTENEEKINEDALKEENEDENVSDEKENSTINN